MDRITDHQLRVIRVAIVGFAVAALVFYSYEMGMSLYEMRVPGSACHLLSTYPYLHHHIH